MDKFHDSAGVPWEGRQFSENTFSDDDGSTPPEISAVYALEKISLEDLFNALKNSRLLVPLIAVVGDKEVGPHGQVVDKSADLSIVAVSTPDGQSAIPAFTSVEQMLQWKSDARPVPIEARRVALAAIAEGHTRVILDPGSRAIGLRRPFLSALAKGEEWIAPFDNPYVVAMVDQAAKQFPSIVSLQLLDGNESLDLRSAELKIELKIKPGFTGEQLNQLLTAFSQAVQSQGFLDLVDSISLKIMAS